MFKLAPILSLVLVRRKLVRRLHSSTLRSIFPCRIEKGYTYAEDKPEDTIPGIYYSREDKYRPEG